jgi:hypothetical protein
VLTCALVSADSGGEEGGRGGRWGLWVSSGGEKIVRGGVDMSCG